MSFRSFASSDVTARYAFALAVVALAIAVRMALQPLLHESVPFVTFFAAVAIAAWQGGRGPALLAIVLGGLAADLFVVEPRFTLKFGTAQYRVGMLMYGLVAWWIVMLFESYRRAQVLAEQKQRELEREVAIRHEAERVLAEREASWRVTLASIGDGVLTTDADGNVEYLNRVAEALTGWHREDAKGRPLTEVFHVVNEETRRPVANPALRALAQGVVVGLANHTILLSRDATERPIDDSAAPIRDEDGRIRGAVLVFRDVSERRREEREQRRTLATLNNLVASAPVGITILDRELRYQHVNAPLAEMNGVPAEDHIGHTVDEIVPSLLESVRPIVHKLLETGQAIPDQILEGETPKEPGVRRIWRESWFPIQDSSGEISRVGVIVQEITEQRRSEERLKTKNERLRLLSETASLLLLADDPRSMLPRLFEKIAPHLGLDAYFHFLKDEHASELRLVSSSGVSPEDAAALSRLQPGQAVCGMAAEACHPIHVDHVQDSREDATRTIKSMGLRAYVCHPLMVGEKVLGTLSFGRRTRDRFEEDELEFLGTIGSYVAFAYERARLIQELSEADRRKDEFLATLAHELRNPLAPVSNSLELLKHADGDKGLLENVRRTMERQIGQMVRLIDDLLDVSRITRNKLELKRERVELASVVHHAVEACRPQLERAGHVLHVQLPLDPVYLFADPVRVAQVVGNLLTNACKYTDHGGRIWLVAERRGGDVEVKVRDTGLGIPAEMLPKVFDLFTQVDHSLERADGGLGIGLSLVKRLTEMHGGSVTARSEGAGRGSEFVVRLPVVEHEPAPAAAVRGSRSSVPSLRILVVDDNRDSADSLAMLLSLSGHTTTIASDGVEGVERAGQFRPQVILLDLGLPRMNGYDVCRTIRREPWGTDMTIIAVTGWGQEADRRKSREAGFDGHLVKPVDHEALLGLLSERTPEPPLANAPDRVVQPSA